MGSGLGIQHFSNESRLLVLVFWDQALPGNQT
jgi:hypothetical protein